jgi:hypothetical protein
MSNASTEGAFCVSGNRATPLAPHFPAPGGIRMIRIRGRHIAAALLIAVLGTGCASTTGGQSTDTGSNGSVQSGAPASSKPTLPSTLPTIKGADSVEKVQRDLIALAAQTAVGAPNEDRHPEVVATSDFACGVKIKAISCPDTNDPVHGKIVIYINPDVTWQQFQQPIGHGGGDEVVQNTTLAAYVQYLAFREIQRKHPADLTAGMNDDAALTRSAQIMMCKNGEVYRGLMTMMSPELSSMWQANASRPQGQFFGKGVTGEC